MTVENKPIDTDIKRYQQKYAANIKERYRQVKSMICAWYYDLWLSSPFVNTRRFLCFGFVSFHFIWFGLVWLGHAANASTAATHSIWIDTFCCVFYFHFCGFWIVLIFMKAKRLLAHFFPFVIFDLLDYYFSEKVLNIRYGINVNPLIDM